MRRRARPSGKSLAPLAAPARRDADPRADDRLLGQARLQWQLGDWQALAAFDTDTLELHAGRAELAPFVIAALLQNGDKTAAARLIERAGAWGLDKKRLLHMLLAGIHNTLARASAIAGRQPAALAHLGQAIELGVPGGALPQIVEAHARAQFERLGLPWRAAARPIAAPPLADGRDLPVLTDALVGDLAARLGNADAGGRRQALEAAAAAMGLIAGDGRRLALALSELQAYGQQFHFLHVAGDHIPGKIVAQRQFYESGFLDLLRAFHRPDALVVDGGANIGNHTVYFARVMEARVVAIEPEPRNATCLAVNIALNGMGGRVSLLRHGIGNRDELLALRMNVEGNFGSFSAMPDANPNRTGIADPMRITMRVRPLDDALAELEPDSAVSILKLDIEGMEAAALEGAAATLARWLPLVAVECFSETIFSAVTDILEPLGYFPVEVANATATFVFVSRHNRFHMARLADHLGAAVGRRAVQYSGFVT